MLYKNGRLKGVASTDYKYFRYVVQHDYCYLFKKIIIGGGINAYPNLFPIVKAEIESISKLEFL